MTATAPTLVQVGIPVDLSAFSGRRHVCTICGGSGPVETPLPHATWCPQDPELAARRHACATCGASSPISSPLRHSGWCPDS